MTDEPRADRDVAAVSRFVERFAGTLVEAGVPRMPSRVFAALLASDAGRLTAAELGEALQVSPAAVSGAMRYLIQVGLASREHEPGSRRDHYQVRDDVWPESIGNRDQLLSRWASVLRDGVAVLGADTPAGARLAESVEFFEFMQKELPGMLDRWREHLARLRAAGPLAAADPSAGADRSAGTDRSAGADPAAGYGPGRVR